MELEKDTVHGIQRVILPGFDRTCVTVHILRGGTRQEIDKEVIFDCFGMGFRKALG